MMKQYCDSLVFSALSQVEYLGSCPKLAHNLDKKCEDRLATSCEIFACASINNVAGFLGYFTHVEMP